MVVPESSINNIMGGLESTGGVTLHNHRRKLKQRFETIAKLGQGTYGKVQLGINKETGQEVAIKTIKKCKIETEADLIRIRREIQIMSSLRHPYIIHIYEVFENRDKMVLVMEYAAGGELYDYLSKKKVLDENEARRIFRQIAMAVYYCHKHQICHRDLKLENILLDEQGNAKIADFGLSNVFDKSRLLSTFCGSPLYASPEIVKGIPYEGPEVDCWSLGVLLYTLVYGAMPFDGSNFKRLVRQISAGEYFEPKNPSSASELIAGLLTVKGSDRLDIGGVCQHPWMAEEGKVSCYRLAVELAEQEPNRLDLLLALAPQENQIPSVPEEVTQSPDRPTRSMSLSSLPTVQPNFTPLPSPSKAEEPDSEREKPSEKEKRRERSTSRTRKKESDDEKPRKKSVKTKKKSDPDLSKEQMEQVLQEARRLSEIIAQSPVKPTEREVIEEPKLPEPQAEAAAASPILPSPSTSEEPPKEKSKETKKVKKPKQEREKDTSVDKDDTKEPTPKTKPKLKKEKEIDIPEKQSGVTKKPEIIQENEKVQEEIVPKEVNVPKESEAVKTNEIKEEVPEIKESTPFRRDSIRRKSKVFETAEMFSKTPTQEKIAPKKVFLPGVKVSDAKAAFERRNSVSQDPRPEYSLASTINVNKLVQNELNKENKEEEKDKIRKENAVKVISHAISESEMNKASTLPRRRLSKPIIPRTEPEHMVANTTVSQIVYPAPIPPPRPSLTKQDSGPKEHIIPIQIERRDDKPPPVSKQASIVSSRGSSISSIGRQDSDSSTTTVGTPSVSASCEPIRKSPREVIIPIAVEGGGYVTPSASTLSKMSSLSEGEDEGPLKSFGLHSTRRRVEATDSLSSDEEDDNFEMLTAENLFSTLLSRVRNLTYRLNENEGRPSFPRLFNHSIFDSPSRRLTETKSFSEQDPTPWRRKRDNASSSTLPRGFTTRSFRRTLTGGDENRRDGRPPPATSLRSRRRSEEDVVEDFLATGKLSSLDRVRSYLEGLRRTNIESASPLRRYLSSESPRPEYPPLPRHRVSSLDDSLRRDHVSNTNLEKSNYEQKKTSRIQSDASCSQNGNTLLNSVDSNGLVDDKLIDRSVEKIDKSVGMEAENESNECSNSEGIESEKLKNDLKITEKSNKKEKKGSRVNKAINSLRKKSEVYDNEFTESKLLKRAVSLEDLKMDDVARGRRASSLKPEGTFEKKECPKAKKGGVFDSLNKKKEDREARIANLKRLDLVKSTEISADSTPTGDQDERESMISATDNSDTWSSCDYGERLLDPSVDDCVSERIRRKSFYHRFNLPKRHTYNRSLSNLERKRYY